MKKRILVVDDTPANVKVLNNFLRDTYRISVAMNGADALEYVRREPPDLILLDIMMPGVDGYEVCRKLKEDPRSSAIPVIFITAKRDIADEQKGLELGAADYITKPISPPITLQRIKNHLELKQARDNLQQLVNERTALLERKVCELEARDRMVRFQMQSADKRTAGREVLSTIALVVESRWLHLFFPGAENSLELGATYSNHGDPTIPAVTEQILHLAQSAMMSGRIERQGALLASPVNYKNETLAVVLLEQVAVADIEDTEIAEALWRMSNEAAMVLRMACFTEDLENDRVDFNALRDLAEKNLQ